MARLIDHMLREKIKSDDPASLLEEATVIIADNVAHYYYESIDMVLGLKDIPTIAPPFDEMFIEWHGPKSVREHGVVTKLDGAAEFYGVQVSSRIIDDDMRLVFPADTIPSDAKWIMAFRLYAMFSGEIASYDAGVSMIALSDGKPWEKVNVIPISKESKNFAEEDWASIIINNASVALLAISLMNCKNVELSTKIPPAPLSKKHQKKYGRPLVRYKVLEIEPMKKVLQTEGKSETLGLKHALHICRGHFKDYSNGSGLFGKYKGLYWWESNVRGNPANGVVVKDYNVNPPQDGSAVN